MHTHPSTFFYPLKLLMFLNKRAKKRDIWWLIKINVGIAIKNVYRYMHDFSPYLQKVHAGLLS